MDEEKKLPLYERFALELEDQIRGGAFPSGTRVPALRESSLQRGLSMTTVLRAYSLLETKGLIEARPQSGYYVRQLPSPAPSGPEDDAAQTDFSEAELDDLVRKLIGDTHNPALAQFGAAFSDPALLPRAKLNRIASELTREDRNGKADTVYPEGREELRVQVARRAFGSGCALRPEELVITVGCSEALTLCLQAVCAPGDLVAIDSPTYFGILQILKALRLRALEIPAKARTGMSLDALSFALDNHPVKAVLAVTNFNNPLGSCMPDEAKRELVAMLEARGIPLIENDIYGELYYAGRRPSVAKSFDKSGNVMLCSSFSKDISEGYRIGWVAPGRRLRELLNLKMAFTIGTSVLPQLIIARFLESGSYDLHLRRIRRAYAKKSALICEAIRGCFPRGTEIAQPLGGYVIWIKLPEGLDSILLYREALGRAISIAPGSIFSPSRRYREHFRLNASVWNERAERDLERLAALASELAWCPALKA